MAALLSGLRASVPGGDTLHRHKIYVSVLAGAHLRVCIEDFDPLGGDEEINFSQGLCISVSALLQDKNERKREGHYCYNSL